jgi:hypothetical protein
MQKPDDGHRVLLLRDRGERPGGGNAGNERGELTPVYVSRCHPLRHGRTWSGHPRLCSINEAKRGCHRNSGSPEFRSIECRKSGKPDLRGQARA